jgi:hypothetical protein
MRRRDGRYGIAQRLLDSDLRAPRLGFTVFLVNARDAKHVPGRKTDVSESHRARCQTGTPLIVLCPVQISGTGSIKFSEMQFYVF